MILVEVRESLHVLNRFRQKCKGKKLTKSPQTQSPARLTTHMRLEMEDEKASEDKSAFVACLRQTMVVSHQV